MSFHAPFDLYYWFVTVFAGNMTMFLAIAFLLIAILAAMFRMPTIIMGLFFAIFIILLAVQTANLFILVLIVIALVIGWSLSRLFK